MCPSDNRWKNKKTKEWEVGINWNSPQQLAEVLYDKLNLKVIEKTPKGGKSTAEGVLLKLKRDHPLPGLIIKYRQAEKNCNTFIEPIQAETFNSYFHPSFKLHGTVTGRSACDRFHQIPRSSHTVLC